jgi:hypothetical protein
LRRKKLQKFKIPMIAITLKITIYDTGHINNRTSSWQSLIRKYTVHTIADKGLEIGHITLGCMPIRKRSAVLFIKKLTHPSRSA